MQAFHEVRLHHRFPQKFGLAAALAVAADVLIYDAIPGISVALFAALDGYLKTTEPDRDGLSRTPPRMLRTGLAWRRSERHRDWRAWSFRSHRLALYIENKGIARYHPAQPDGAWSVQ